MKTIDLKNILGETLFSYTCSENSEHRTLDQAIKHGIRFEKFNLSGFDLSDLTIENITFEGCIFPKEFKGTTFRNCTIRDCSLVESRLSGVVFSRTTIERLGLSKSELKNCGFAHCVVNQINAEKSFFKKMRFAYCEGGVDAPESTFEDCRFLYSFMAGAILKKAKMYNTIFTNCDVQKSNFEYGNFSNVKFNGCEMLGCVFVGSQFISDSKFESCDIKFASFKECTFIDADFSKNQIIRCDFSNCMPVLLSMFSCHINDTNFEYITSGNRIHFDGSVLSQVDSTGTNPGIMSYSGNTHYNTPTDPVLSGIISVSGTGSEGRTTVYDINTDTVYCGCFTGSLDKFLERVIQTYGHPENVFKKQYLSVIDLFTKCHNMFQLKAGEYIPMLIGELSECKAERRKYIEAKIERLTKVIERDSK